MAKNKGIESLRLQFPVHQFIRELQMQFLKVGAFSFMVINHYKHAISSGVPDYDFCTLL